MAIDNTEARDNRPSVRGSIASYIIDWTSDVAGQVNSGIGFLNGELVAIDTAPGAKAPDNLYSVVIEDENGFDVALGLATGRSNVNVQRVFPRESVQGAISSPINGQATLKVTGAGDGNKGKVVIYLK